MDPLPTVLMDLPPMAPLMDPFPTVLPMVNHLMAFLPMDLMALAILDMAFQRNTKGYVFYILLTWGVLGGGGGTPV